MVLISKSQKDVSLDASSGQQQSPGKETARAEGTADSFVPMHHLPSSPAISQSTPVFLTKMIDYCFDEINHSLAEIDVDYYADSIDQLVSQLATPSYPLDRVSSSDRRRIAQDLAAIHARFLSLHSPANEGEEDLFKHALQRINELAEKIKALENADRCVEVAIEDRVDSWQSKSTWGRKREAPNCHVSYVGCKLPDAFAKRSDLANYVAYGVLGDGGCWARALWQATLSQILDDGARFDAFTSKVKQTRADFGSDRHFFSHNDLSDVLAILEVLKHANPEQRLEMLNHDRVDLTLQMFMRKLIAAQFRQRNPGRTEEEAQYIDRIEIPTTFGGGFEIMTFAQYFNIAIHEVSKVSKKGQMTLQHHVYNAGSEIFAKAGELPPVMLYGVSSIHYEILKRA